MKYHKIYRIMNYYSIDHERELFYIQYKKIYENKIINLFSKENWVNLPKDGYYYYIIKFSSVALAEKYLEQIKKKSNYNQVVKEYL